MTRSIISKFIVALIILFTALSVFWFFKTSTVKKHILAMIAASNGKISAISVSVSGFPINQKLKVENLKFEVEPIAAFGKQMPGKYQINIKNFEATANIFSNDFTVNTIQDVSFVDAAGNTNLVQFNQNPQSTFSFSGGFLSKLSYQDSGYKVVSAANVTLLENGSSVVHFEAVAESDKLRHKIKADFKDVSIFDSLVDSGSANNNVPNNIPANTTPEAVAATANSSTPAPAVSLPPAVEVDNSNLGLVKKNIALEVEYVLAPNNQVQNAASPDEISANMVSNSNMKLESLNIKNFEITSPLYKVNVNGNISTFQKDLFPIGNLSARVEKLDNILIYLKKYITSATVENQANPHPIPSTEGGVNVDIKTAATLQPESANVPTANQKPADIVMIIKDLAKKNVASNDEIAVFDFRQEQDKDLIINETPLPEIMSQFFLSSMVDAASVPAVLDNNLTIPAPSANSALPTSPAPAASAPSVPATPAVVKKPEEPKTKAASQTSKPALQPAKPNAN